MPQLRPQPFSRELVQLAQSIDCGDDDWGREATDWIRCSDDHYSALTDIADYDTDVWLYRLETTREVVGFGSLGKNNWNLGKGQDKQPVWIIPNIGIDRRFHGQPKGCKPSDKYSHQLMQHLIDHATDRTTDQLLIGLLVRQGNDRAKKLYEDFGFTSLGQPNKSGLIRMARRV